MKYYLWLIVLFVLIPISTMRADEKKSFILEIPNEIMRDYITKQNLVPLDYIDLGDDVGVVPFVTAEEKTYMDKYGEIPIGFEVRLEAIFCLCTEHEGNRVQVINAFIVNIGMIPLWVNPALKGGG